MDGADAYTIFKQSLVNEIRELRGLILLRTPDSLEPWQDTLNELGTRVQEIEKKIALLKAQVAKEMQFVELTKQLKAQTEQQHADISYIQTHLPARLPGKAPVDLDSAPPARVRLLDEPTLSDAPAAPSLQSSASGASVVPPKEDTKKSDAKKAASTVQVPTIQYVTVSEFEGTPKYMKGRLTLDKLNAAIDEMQKLLQAKYKILSLNPAKMIDTTLKKYKTYKDAETKETKGLYFLTDADMAESTALRQGDATGKAAIGVLRHLHRIKDLGGTTKRYAVL
jgi:hypothetical protein